MKLFVVTIAALIASQVPSFAQSGGTNGAATTSGAAPVQSMNPAARRSDSKDTTRGTKVPGATGVNPYSGKSVGVPLQPNDLGSPEQTRKEP